MTNLTILLLISVTKLGNWIISAGAIVSALFVIFKLVKPIKRRYEKWKAGMMQPALTEIHTIRENMMTLGNRILEGQAALQDSINAITNKHSFMGEVQKQMLDKQGILWVICDSKGYTKEISPALSRYMGLPESEQEGANWMNNVPRQYHKSIKEEWDICIETGKPYKMEYPIMKGDGFLQMFRVYAIQGGEDWFLTLTPIETPNKKKLQAMA